MESARQVPRPTPSPRRTDNRSRLLAAAALALALVSVVVGVIVAVRHFPLGLIVLCLIAAAGVSAWHGLLRRGLGRVALLALAVVMAVVAIVLLLGRDPLATVVIGGIISSTLLGLAVLPVMLRLLVGSRGVSDE